MFKFFLAVLLLLAPMSYAHNTPVEEVENRVKVAVIDTGVKETPYIKPFLCKSGHISFVDKAPFTDDWGHGTNVVGLIAENINFKTHCIVMIKFLNPNTPQPNFSKNVILGIKHATQIGAKFLNLSLGGESYIKAEHDALRDAIKSGMKIAVAAGNDSGKGVEKDAKGNIVFKRDRQGNLVPKKHSPGEKFVCKPQDEKAMCYFYEVVEVPMGTNLDKNCVYYPACYQFDRGHFHVVGSSTGRLNNWGGEHRYSNYGRRVPFREDGTVVGNPVMTGTSQATAIHTGKWASGKIK